MNGMGTRKAFGLESDAASPFRDVLPTGRAMAAGYRQEAMDGFEPSPARYNPANADRPQSSPLVDLQDPIQVHLLTETALSDSREWVILSPEEVDDLKKQCQSLSQRIEQTRANLAIQSKYRDAAISMAKLYSPSQAGKRRSILSNRSSSDGMREAEAERQACERRCEQLATELFTLEKRLMEPQRQLFQHTAGILQLAHRAAARSKAAPAGLPFGAIPGSPESMYTYANDRESMEIVAGGDGMFDDRSLYLPIDPSPLEGAARAKKNAIEIPQKSPVRKETMELREESDRLRAECGQLRAECSELRASVDSLSLEVAALQRDNGERQQAMADAEQQLRGLNGRLCELVVQFNPAKNGGYAGPPPPSGDGASLVQQLQYLGDSLDAAQQEQALAVSALAQQAELGSTLMQLEGRLAAVNGQMQRILSAAGSASQSPPAVSGLGSGAGLSNQLDWLQDLLPTIEAEVGRAAEAAGAVASERQAAEQADTVLTGLWEIMQTGFADRQRERAERKASRAQMGVADGEDEDVSGDESPFAAGGEVYSLAAFSAKVQWLYAQTTTLRDHKSVLKRQIKQQRELNSKSDAEKDRELQEATAALQTKTAALQEMQRAAEEAQTQLAQTLLDLGTAEERLAQKEGEAAQAAERGAALAALEAQSSEQQAALARAEASVAGLTAQLAEAAAARDAAAAARDAAAASAAEAAAAVQSKDAELEKLNAMVVELKTEATIAKAELEGAYGSRTQRARDVAAFAKSAENEELQQQLDKMKTELAGTLKEYEDLTKDTIAAEREKLDLEGQLDDALAARTALEAELRTTREKLEAEVAALKDELDAEKLKVVAPAGGGGASSRAGASMLSEQFRATMKVERKKFQEELRNEQAQRRKLEEELRALRRAAGPGKSPLSPR